LSQTQRIDERTYETIKGVLNFFVILDHNDILRTPREVQDLFLPMTFHVAGFLLLPFLGTPHRLSMRFVSDRAARYLVPFMMATIGYAALFHFLMSSGETLPASVNDTMIALAIGTASTLKIATGFIILWFLPTLFTLVIVYAIFECISRFLEFFLFMLACCVHLTLGLAPDWVGHWTPGNLHLALFMLPLGLAMRRLHLRLLPLGYPHRLGLAALALLLGTWAIEYGRESEVATAKMPSILGIGHLLAIDISMISCMVALLSFGPLLARVPILPRLGRHSLVVYLVHPLIYFPVLAALNLMHPAAHTSTALGFTLYIMAIASSVAFTTATSLLIAIALQRFRILERLIMPRGWHDWLPVALLR
jgi:hypothetical protein